MKRLWMVVLLVAGCGSATTGPSLTSPSPIESSTATADASSSASVSTPSANSTTTPIDATLVTSFKAAYARFTKALPLSSDLSDPNDWSAAQRLFTKQADAYDAFGRDLEAIRFPETVVLNGERQYLGSDAAALIGWSKELATVLRQVAAARSLAAAMQDTVEFDGSSYPMQSFLQDASGEWGASLRLTSADLGVDLSQP